MAVKKSAELDNFVGRCGGVWGVGVWVGRWTRTECNACGGGGCVESDGSIGGMVLGRLAPILDKEQIEGGLP